MHFIILCNAIHLFLNVFRFSFLVLQFSNVFKVIHVDGSHLDNGRNIIFCITRQSIFFNNRYMELCTGCTDLCSICAKTTNIAIDSKALWLLQWTQKCSNKWWNENQRNHVYIRNSSFFPAVDAAIFVVAVTIFSNQCSNRSSQLI